MNRSAAVFDDDAQFGQLLAQVRARLMAAGCANRLDARIWLERWLLTPNPAFGGALPRDVLQAGAESRSQPQDIAAELMGRPDQMSFQVSPRHW